MTVLHVVCVAATRRKPNSLPIRLVHLKEMVLVIVTATDEQTVLTAVIVIKLNPQKEEDRTLFRSAIYSLCYGLRGFLCGNANIRVIVLFPVPVTVL